MQTKYNPEYYLKRNFYKEYSSYGTPFLAGECNLKTSDNLIIYGHNMNNNTMFAPLEKYKNYNFYINHKYIKFYTIENGKTIENIYEVMIAFKTIAYSDTGFKYYSYNNFKNIEDYEKFVENCRKLEFYDTGVIGNNENKYLTLSTCEYSQKNGRMVVVAKKI
jgi:sortase B